MKTSPSEHRGRSLGIHMLTCEPYNTATSLDGGGLNITKVCAKFEVLVNNRRHSLTAFAKSRQGAWRVAVRWWRKIRGGKL